MHILSNPGSQTFPNASIGSGQEHVESLSFSRSVKKESYDLKEFIRLSTCVPLSLPS